MFSTLKTLIDGRSARAEERVRDTYALELIDQKIREAQTSLKAAKATLAALIQRQRGEERQVDGLQTRIATMTKRAEDALKGDREDLAQEAANAIAQLENELDVRKDTLNRLEQKALRLRQSVEASHRRIVDLKQGAISARAVRMEQRMQSNLNTTITAQSSAAEAEELIANVIGKADPLEQSEIMSEIEESLNHNNVEDRMASAGFGPATKTTGADVLARLKTKK